MQANLFKIYNYIIKLAFLATEYCPSGVYEKSTILNLQSYCSNNSCHKGHSAKDRSKPAR